MAKKTAAGKELLRHSAEGREGLVMTTPLFFIPSSLNLKELLEDIDSRIAALDVLEESIQLHEEDLAVMAKHLDVQHQLLQLMIGDLRRVVRGANLLAA